MPAFSHQGTLSAADTSLFSRQTRSKAGSQLYQAPQLITPNYQGSGVGGVTRMCVQNRILITKKKKERNPTGTILSHVKNTVGQCNKQLSKRSAILNYICVGIPTYLLIWKRNCCSTFSRCYLKDQEFRLHRCAGHCQPLRTSRVTSDRMGFLFAHSTGIIRHITSSTSHCPIPHIKFF